MRVLVAGTMGIAALLAPPGGARAWEEPDAAYAKFQGAVKSGSAEEIVRLSSAVRRADMAARKESELREAQAAAPSAYALEQKTVSRDGQSAKLFLSAPGEAFAPPRAGAQFGIARLVLEGGEWKIVDQTWAREKPPELGPRRTQAGDDARNVRDVTKPRAQPRPPTLKLARPACSYKGAMTDEEIERCR